MVYIKCTLVDLRRAVSIKTCTPVGELELEVNGKAATEARSRPFAGKPDVGHIVRWFRGARLGNLLRSRRLTNICSKDSNRRTALHYTVLNGDFDLCQEVLDHKDCPGQLIQTQDLFGDSALMMASILGYSDLVELLLDRQASVEQQNIFKRTALMLASEHDHHAVVTALLRAGATKGPVPQTNFPDAPYLADLNQRYDVLDAMRKHEKSISHNEVLDG